MEVGPRAMGLTSLDNYRTNNMQSSDVGRDAGKGRSCDLTDAALNMFANPPRSAEDFKMPEGVRMPIIRPADFEDQLIQARGGRECARRRWRVITRRV